MPSIRTRILILGTILPAGLHALTYEQSALMVGGFGLALEMFL